MALPVRTWTWDTNNPVTNSPAGLLAGYQAAAFALKEAFRLCGTGATGIRSSDGTTASDADNWATAADVVLGASGAGSWWTAQLGVDAGGADPVYVLLYVNETAVALATSGSVFEVLLSTTPWTGGSNTALPTNAGNVSNAAGTRANLFPSSTGGSDLNWTVMYSDVGDVWFWSKENGGPVSVSTMFVVFNDDEGGGSGETRVMLRRTVSAYTASTLIDSSWTTLANNEALNPSTGVWGPLGLVSSPTLDLELTAGVDLAGNTPTALGVFIARTQRFLGEHPDLYFTPNLPAGTLDADEAGQTNRRVALGDVMVFMPDADLPIP